MLAQQTTTPQAEFQRFLFPAGAPPQAYGPNFIVSMQYANMLDGLVMSGDKEAQMMQEAMIQNHGGNAPWIKSATCAAIYSKSIPAATGATGPPGMIVAPSQARVLVNS